MKNCSAFRTEEKKATEEEEKFCRASKNGILENENAMRIIRFG